MDRRSFFRFGGKVVAGTGAAMALIPAKEVVQTFENPSHGNPPPKVDKPPDQVGQESDSDLLASLVSDEAARMVDDILSARGYFASVEVRKFGHVAQRGDCIAREWSTPRPMKTGKMNELMPPRDRIFLDHHIFAQAKVRDVMSLFTGSEARSVRIFPMAEELAKRIEERTGPLGRVVATAPTATPIYGSGACGKVSEVRRFPIKCIITYDPNSLAQLIILDVLFGVRA